MPQHAAVGPAGDPQRELAGGPLDAQRLVRGARAGADRPPGSAVGVGHGERRRGGVGHQGLDALVEQAGHQRVPGGEAGRPAQVDGVQSHLAPAHPGHVPDRAGPAGRAGDRGLEAVGGQVAPCGGHVVGAGEQARDVVGARAARTRLDRMVPRLAGGVHQPRVVGVPGAAQHGREGLGVVGQVRQHVPPGPAREAARARHLGVGEQVRPHDHLERPRRDVGHDRVDVRRVLRHRHTATLATRPRAGAGMKAGRVPLWLVGGGLPGGGRPGHGRDRTPVRRPSAVCRTRRLHGSEGRPPPRRRLEKDL